MALDSTQSSPRRTSREEQAHAEIGVTDIQRPVAIGFVVFFLTVLFSGLALVLFSREERSGLASVFDGVGTEMRESASAVDAAGVPRCRLARLLEPNRTLRERFERLEARLDERFPAAVVLRKPVQTLLAWLGEGEEQVLIGRDGWLYYAPDVTALAGPGLRRGRRDQEDPTVAAVAAFAEALAEHQIQLIVLPTPIKPAVHPEGLTPSVFPWRSHATDRRAGFRVRGYDDWVLSVRARGVGVFDAMPVLEAERDRAGRAYLRGDTHWTPDAMDAVAAALALEIGPPFDDAPPKPTETGARRVTHVGDTAMMLALPETHSLRTPESVDIRPVAQAFSADATVVVLGDSFSNIFSSDDMGWGSDAGFPERLAWHLGRSVRPFVRNANGAWASRERWVRALARGDARLDGVRVVVWQFAERELAHGDWRTLPLPTARPDHARLASVGGATEGRPPARVTARIAAVSDGPRRDAPYADFLIKWHVTEIRDLAGAGVPGVEAAVVVLPGMRQRIVLPAAGVRAGARVTLVVRPWAEVEAVYGTCNAGTLEDTMLELDLPLLWGEWLEEER